MNATTCAPAPVEVAQHGYIGFFKGKRIELYAPTLFAAKEKAIGEFKAKRRDAHMVSVVLAELNAKPGTPGTQVTHVADF